MAYIITNIKWDTDGEPVENLPRETTVPENIDEEDIADYLSDKYGFCLFGYSVEKTN